MEWGSVVFACPLPDIEALANFAQFWIAHTIRILIRAAGQIGWEIPDEFNKFPKKGFFYPRIVAWRNSLARIA